MMTTNDQWQRVARTAVQAGLPAVLAAIAAATTEIGKTTEWWAPLVLAVLTTVTSVLHQKVRPAQAPAADQA
jgi:predicted permease